MLAELASQRTCQVVLVASSSTTQEMALTEELRRAGVRVLTEYLPHVEHLYQLADCYLFPVQSSDHSIGVPLSVLEAFACDLPVVTTRFGGLTRFFGEQEHGGLVFVDSPAALAQEAVRLCRLWPAGTRILAEPYSWDAVASRLIDHVLARGAPSC
jgi:glycosyltransferase involved in cell wall biosynthesis